MSFIILDLLQWIKGASSDSGIICLSVWYHMTFHADVPHATNKIDIHRSAEVQLILYLENHVHL